MMDKIKVKVLFIKFEANQYGYGLTDFELETLKQAHQCDLVVCVPVSQPVNDIEYPYFEIKEFEAKEQSFVDTYENEIESLKELIKDRDGEITNLKWESANKVSAWYKTLFYTVLISFLAASVVLLTK